MQNQGLNNFHNFHQEFKAVREQIELSFKKQGMVKLKPMSLLFHVEKEVSIRLRLFRKCRKR
jgi:hypothetical protein